MNKPFGLRVFIKKTDNPLSNFGKDILEGVVVDVPTEQSILSSFIINTMSTNHKDMTKLNYNYLFGDYKGILGIGTKVKFKYNQDIIDNDGDIYNVPIELIRTYSEDE